MEEQSENRPASENISQITPIFSSINESIQQIAALVLGAGTVLSLGGYIIVQSYLWTWTDIQPYNVVPIQYLAAGTGFLFFTAVVCTLIWLSFNLSNRRNFFLFILIVSGIIILARQLSAGTSSGFWLSLSSPLILLGLAAIVILIVQVVGKLIYWISPQKLRDFFSRPPKPSNQKNFELLSMRSFNLFVLGLVYTILGAWAYNQLIYSSLPRYFGGGAFSDITIMLRNPDEWDEVTQAIYQSDQNLNYLPGLCLLAELDDAYLVIIPMTGGSYYTLTIPRSSVLSIVDIDYGQTCAVNPPSPSTPPQGEETAQATASP